VYTGLPALELGSRALGAAADVLPCRAGLTSLAWCYVLTARVGATGQRYRQEVMKEQYAMDIRMKHSILPAIALAATLAVSASAQAQHASFYQCDGCTVADMRETAMLIGSGDHHLYNIQTQTLKRYVVQGGGGQPQAVIGSGARGGAQDSEKPDDTTDNRSAGGHAQAAYGSQPIVLEQIPDPRVAAIFRDMIALDAQYPGVFNSSSSVEAPIETVGSWATTNGYRHYSPAGIALVRPVGGTPGGGEYNSFMDALRSALERADAGLGGRLSGLLNIGNRINGVSVQGAGVGLGLSWDNFHAPTLLSLCNSGGACVVVRVDPKTKQIEFVRAHDQFNNDYPPAVGSNFGLPFPTPQEADHYGNDLASAGIRVSRETRGNGPRLRSTVVCMYVNGMLDGCTIIVERY
jgi:hypothetical protein